MDRVEWGGIVGDHGEIEDDLRWSLFGAERCVTAIDRDKEEGVNHVGMDVERAFKRQVRDAKVALAALWARQGPPAIG